MSFFRLTILALAVAAASAAASAGSIKVLNFKTAGCQGKPDYTQNLDAGHCVNGNRWEVNVDDGAQYLELASFSNNTCTTANSNQFLKCGVSQFQSNSTFRVGGCEKASFLKGVKISRDCDTRGANCKQNVNLPLLGCVNDPNPADKGKNKKAMMAVAVRTFPLSLSLRSFIGKTCEGEQTAAMEIPCGACSEFMTTITNWKTNVTTVSHFSSMYVCSVTKPNSTVTGGIAAAGNTTTNVHLKDDTLTVVLGISLGFVGLAIMALAVVVFMTRRGPKRTALDADDDKESRLYVNDGEN